MTMKLGEGVKFRDGSIGIIIQITGSKELPYYKIKFIKGRIRSDYFFESDFDEEIKLTKAEVIAYLI